MYKFRNSERFSVIHYNTAPVNIAYFKPVAFSSTSCFHYYFKNRLLHYTSKERLQCLPQRGIVFEWPQREKSYPIKELCFATWLIAHIMFWLHITHILPNGSALILNQPPWRYVPPVSKPENRDYIIEPDWNSYM